MDSVPVLILGYNRPEKLETLIRSLKHSKPELVLVSIDGPKSNDDLDHEQVKRTREVVSGIDWTQNVETRYRTSNVGLRSAVEDSVTWAVEKYGAAIVIEDDTIAGPLLVPYLTKMLQLYEHDDRVMHISGYNVVPPSQLTSMAGSRHSLYPESFAWGTWARAWDYYDPELAWASKVSIEDLSQLLGSRAAAIRWKVNFADAKSGRINTWAYRWLASIWSRNGTTIAPNTNLARYSGFDNGTHTFRSPRWKDLPLNEIDDLELLYSILEEPDADPWTGKHVFRESKTGIIDGLVTSVLLEGRKRLRQTRGRLHRV